MEELKKLQDFGAQKGLQVFLSNPYGLGRFVVHSPCGEIIFESRTAKAVLSFISKHQ